MKNIKHEWVTYYSPRNGSIGVQACSFCGAAKGLAPSRRGCTKRAPEQHLMLMRGWIPEGRSAA